MGDGRSGGELGVVSATRPRSPLSARAGRAARVGAACGLALVWCVAFSAPSAALDDVARTSRPGPSTSVSSGLPWDGRLQNGVRLRRSAIVRPVAVYARSRNFFGTSELVAMLERTAQAIAARWPGSQLGIGELSGPAGGKIDGHNSHRSGRDADVAFFMNDSRGRASFFRRFVAFGDQGIALRPRRQLYFDDARNWALVATMLRDPQARVQYVFVSQPLRTRLLMEGRRQGAGEDFLRAAAAVMVEPRAGHKHDNHFHVRIYCPRDDRPECQDSEPYWPWYDGRPPAGQYADLPVIRWRMPGVTSPQPVGHAERASGDPRSI